MSLNNHHFRNQFNDPFFEGMMDNQFFSAPFAHDPFFNRANNLALMQNPMANPNNALVMMDNMMTQMMTPFRAPMFSMNSMMNNFERLASDPNCHTYSSSSVMTYSSSGDGREPRIYQASTSTRAAPNGIKETKKSARDSASGMQKMAVSHHLGDRSHTIEETHNSKTGQKERLQDFINLTEEDAEEFDSEWQERIRTSARPYTIRGNNDNIRRSYQRGLPSTKNVDYSRRVNAAKEYVPPTPPRHTGTRDTKPYEDYRSGRVRFNSRQNKRYN